MHLNGSSLRAASIAILAASALFAAPAFANKDIPYPSAATATVSGGSVAISTATNVGAQGSGTLSEALYPGQQVDAQVTWSIQDNSDRPGQDTDYGTGLSLTFTPSTTVTPASAVPVTAMSNCTVTSSGSTCVRSIKFDAPDAVGNYQVKVSLGGSGYSGSNGLSGTANGTFNLNFSVAEPVAVLLDTKLAVAKQCVLFNAGNVNLEATLEELVSGDAIAGASIDFFVDPPSTTSGTGVTDVNGNATLGYNVNGLAVGDHTIFAQYAGNAGYNPSDDSNVLGVSYLFGGFQQPINADGTSVFGNGRVIPVKIRVADANGQTVADAAPTVWVTQYSASTGLGEVLEPATSVSAADTGNVMRYDPEAGQYIYNWDLSAMTNGTYAVIVDLGDSRACSTGPYHAVITVARKKK